MSKMSNTPESQAAIAAAIAEFLKTQGVVVQVPPQANPRTVTAR